MRRLPPTETLLTDYAFYPFDVNQENVHNEIMSSVYVSEYIHPDDSSDAQLLITYARSVISCIISYLISTSSTVDSTNYSLTYDLNDYIDANDVLEIPRSDIPTQTSTIDAQTFVSTIVNYINRSLEQFGVLFDMWYDVESVDLISAMSNVQKQRRP